METTNPTRRIDLDWIRIAAFGLLIAYHVGMYYVSWDWHVKSPFASDALEPVMLALNPWRLSLLFLVSGCATAYLLRATAATGLGRVAWQRSRFLLVPVLFGMVAVVPPQSYYEVVDRFGFADGYLGFWQRYLAADHSFCRTPGNCLVLPTWNHLWFVVYLWVYTMLLLAARKILAGDALSRWALRALSGWRLLVLPWVWLAFARMVLLPRFPSTHALFGDFYNHAQYLPVFAIGYLLARDEAAWHWMAARRWTLLALAAAAYAVVLAYALHFSGPQTPPEGVRVAMRGVYALLQWSAILAVLGWARHLLGSMRDTPARAYFSNAVFCYYVVHQTVIIVVAHALRPLALPPAAEGPLLILVTFAACAASYELARRMPLLRPLFGIRGGRISLRADGVSRRPAAVSS